MSLDSLLQQLHHPEPEVRRQAIHELGQLQHPRTMHALKAVVRNDPVPACRKAALYWLGQTAAQADFNEAVRQALQDPDPTVRWDAAWNVRQAGGPNPGIVEALIEVAMSEAEQPVSFAMVVSALGVLGDPRALDPLLAQLKSPSGYRRAAAAQALGALGDSRAIPHLTALLEDDAAAWQEDHGPARSVADVACEALRRLGAPGEVTALRR